MYLKDLYARSHTCGYALGLDALQRADVHTTQALTMAVLSGTPDFGTTSKEYLILALVDEVHRLHRMINVVRLELCKEAQT